MLLVINLETILLHVDFSPIAIAITHIRIFHICGQYILLKFPFPYLICIYCQIDKFSLSIIYIFTTIFLLTTIWKATPKILPRFLKTIGLKWLMITQPRCFWQRIPFPPIVFLIGEEFNLVELIILLISPTFFLLIGSIISIFWFVTRQWKWDLPWGTALLVERARRILDWLAAPGAT